MSNTATMLRKTEAELRDALAEVARLRKVNADLIAMANRARMAQLEAEGVHGRITSSIRAALLTGLVEDMIAEHGLPYRHVERLDEITRC